MSSRRKKKRTTKKAAKPRIVRKSRVEKPFNCGTMSKAAFFGMLKNSLRRLSMYWKPIAKARANARRKYNGSNKRQMWEYKCNKCENYFPGSQISVDHTTPVGSLNDFDDISGVVKRLFVECEELQTLCTTCHNAKSLSENTERKERKKSFVDNIKTSTPY